MEKLEVMVVMMMERFMDVPDTAVFGASAYSELLKEMHQYRQQFNPGFHTVQIYTSGGPVKILMSNLVPPDHISVGTIELETMKLFETVERLGIKNFAPFGFSY